MAYKPDAQKLKKICDLVVNASEFKPSGGVTKCNLAVRKILEGMGIDLFFDKKSKRVLLANEMITFIGDHPAMFARYSDTDSAIADARGGYVIMACQRGQFHGHVAILYPKGSEHSASWGKMVPMLANVGKENKVMRASECFRTEPDYYCILPF